MFRQMTRRGLLALVYDYTPTTLKRAILRRRQSSGSGMETQDVGYCMGVWLKHIANGQSAGLERPPATVAEIGPGQSIGVGLAALICGAEHYAAFDAVYLLRPQGHLRMFDELVVEFKKLMEGDAADRPALLTKEAMTVALDASRIAKIREQVARLDSGSDPNECTYLAYTCPWEKTGLGQSARFDLVLSHAAIMYVPDPQKMHNEVSRVLKKGGCASHQIDFSSVGLTKFWDGHWELSDRAWKILSSRRPYSTNRMPHSGHLAALAAAGLTVTADVCQTRKPTFPRSKLSKRFAEMSDQDRETYGTLVAATKR